MNIQISAWKWKSGYSTGRSAASRLAALNSLYCETAGLNRISRLSHSNAGLSWAEIYLSQLKPIKQLEVTARSVSSTGIPGQGSIYYTIMNIRFHYGVLRDIEVPWTLWLRVFPHVHKTDMLHKLIMEALGRAELNYSA